VTIAAGFRFDGGIVLCADSEESTGQSVKVSVPKIEIVDKKFSKLVFTGAGDADMLNRAFEDITNSVGARYTHEAIRYSIESVVSDLYREYVYPIPGDDKPYFELLVAYQTAKGCDFVKITRNVTVRPKNYEVIGLGFLHAAHLMNRWYHDGMSEAEAILLAAYVLQQTKLYVPSCGGPSRICILRPDGTVEWVSPVRIMADERYVERFDATMRVPFFACANPAVTDEQFEAILQSVQVRLLGLRHVTQTRPVFAHSPGIDASAKPKNVRTGSSRPTPLLSPKQTRAGRVLRDSKRDQKVQPPSRA
jgi:20S proteasome alpha/beta subunit